MKAEEIVAAIQSGFMAAKVVFKDGRASFEEGRPVWGQKQYTYKVLEILNLAAGDLAIVDTPKGGMEVVKVVAIGDATELDFSNSVSSKWIVQKLDCTLYNNITNQESELIKNVKVILRKQTQQAFLKDFTHILDGNPDKDAIVENLMQAADMKQLERVVALAAK